MDTPRSSYPTFSWTERRRLLRALEQAHDARLYRRLRAVAEIAEGESVAVVAKRARVERSTVYRWIERYLAERAPSALADGKRSGRPRLTPALTDAKLRQLLTSEPCQFGYDANTWTVPLRKWGKSPGRFGDRPYRSAIGRQKLAESRARCSDFERMLHLRARTFAPITTTAG